MNHHSEDKNTGISTPSDQHNSIYSEPLFVKFSTATPEQRKGFANLKNLPGSLLKRSLNFSLCCDFIYRKDMHRFNGMWIPYPIEYTHILPRSNLVQLFKFPSNGEQSEKMRLKFVSHTYRYYSSQIFVGCYVYKTICRVFQRLS